MAIDIDKLAKDVAACRLCVENPIGKPLPHEPRPVVVLSKTARLCVAGQAPGTKVHASGKPFDDRSGDRLRDWMSVDRETFYDETRIVTVPMGFCFPGQDAKGGDLPPRKECAPQWRERIFGSMPQIELILCIGMYAQEWHMGAARGKTLTETVQNWRNHFGGNEPGRVGRAKILPLPHPSWRNSGWLRKNPWFETELLPVLKQEVKRLIAK